MWCLYKYTVFDATNARTQDIFMILLAHLYNNSSSSCKTRVDICLHLSRKIVLCGGKYGNLKFQFLPRRRHTNRLMEFRGIVRNYHENHMKPVNRSVEGF